VAWAHKPFGYLSGRLIWTLAVAKAEKSEPEMAKPGLIIGAVFVLSGAVMMAFGVRSIPPPTAGRAPVRYSSVSTARTIAWSPSNRGRHLSPAAKAGDRAFVAAR